MLSNLISPGCTFSVNPKLTRIGLVSTFFTLWVWEVYFYLANYFKHETEQGSFAEITQEARVPVPQAWALAACIPVHKELVWISDLGPALNQGNGRNWKWHRLPRGLCHRGLLYLFIFLTFTRDSELTGFLKPCVCVPVLGRGTILVRDSLPPLFYFICLWFPSPYPQISIISFLSRLSGIVCWLSCTFRANTFLYVPVSETKPRCHWERLIHSCLPLTHISFLSLKSLSFRAKALSLSLSLFLLSPSLPPCFSHCLSETGSHHRSIAEELLCRPDSLWPLKQSSCLYLLNSGHEPSYLPDSLPQETCLTTLVIPFSSHHQKDRKRVREEGGTVCPWGKTHRNQERSKKTQKDGDLSVCACLEREGRILNQTPGWEKPDSRPLPPWLCVSGRCTADSQTEPCSDGRTLEMSTLFSFSPLLFIPCTPLPSGWVSRLRTNPVLVLKPWLK